MDSNRTKQSSHADDGSKWEVLDRQLVFDASPWVRLYRDVVQLPTGCTIDDFYHVRLPDFVEVLAVTPRHDFVMVRGYKHAVGREILSPPAGMVDEGEDPLSAAKRELLEETGYRAKSWQKIGEYVTDGNRHCGVMYLFYATDAEPVQTPKEDEREPLRCELLDARSVADAVFDGQFGNLPGVAAAALGLLYSHQLSGSPE